MESFELRSRGWGCICKLGHTKECNWSIECTGFFVMGWRFWSYHGPMK
jgi:hypothetical protein